MSAHPFRFFKSFIQIQNIIDFVAILLLADGLSKTLDSLFFLLRYTIMVRVHSLFIASVNLGHGLGGEGKDDNAKECDGMDVVSYLCNCLISPLIISFWPKFLFIYISG